MVVVERQDMLILDYVTLHKVKTCSLILPPDNSERLSATSQSRAEIGMNLCSVTRALDLSLGVVWGVWKI